MLILGLTQFGSAVTITTQTFTFVGQCSDCSGTATAQLVLANYTPGTPILNGNFISLTYTSNLLNFVLNSSDNPSVSGSIPASLPSAAGVFIFGPGNKVLDTQQNGRWCSGLSCDSDFGPGHTWNAAAATATSAAGAPALNKGILVSLAVAMAAMGALLVRKAASSV